MTLTILNAAMHSSRSPHTARLLPGEGHPRWEVSWLPGRPLNYNQAITAMTIADTATLSEADTGIRLWPHLQGWAAELGMTAPEALGKVTGLPRWAAADLTATPAGPETDDPEAAG